MQTMHTRWTRLALFVLVGAMTSFGWAAQNQGQSNDDNGPQQRLQRATQILESMTGPAAKAGIPSAVFHDAKCVAVIPGMVKGAIIVGARHGDGVATCRTQTGWSAPAFFQLTGASIGPQIGGQKTDLILMVMNDQGMDGLLSGKFKLGAGASVAAGPVGRQASASGGWKAAILSYSRSKGAFAGANVNGAEIQADDSAMNQFYNKNVSFSDALKGSVPPPAAAQAFLNSVQQAHQMASE
jgi:lipid-binding SYLF domain-containing protein